MGQYKMAVVLGLRHSDIPAPVLHEGARRDAIATLAKHSRRVDDLRAAIYGGQP